MPKDVNISPGQTFYEPAAQEANLANLLKILSKKEATEALTALAKTDKSTWADIRFSVDGLNEFIGAGGLGSFTEEISATIKFQIENLFSDLLNEVDQLMADALEPILKIANDIINDLTDFVSGNTTGALIGGIAGLFLPGGTIMVAIGAVVGALIEEYIDEIIDFTSGGKSRGDEYDTYEDLMAIADKYDFTEEELWYFMRGEKTLEEILADRVTTGWPTYNPGFV